MSNIKVSVKWASSAVFAGEEVQCIITFENVASAHTRSQSPSPNSLDRGTRDRWKGRAPRSTSSGINNEKPSQLGRGRPRAQAHRPSISLGTSVQTPRKMSPVLSDPAASEHPIVGGGRHQRSVSVVSIGNAGGGLGSHAASGAPERRRRKTSAPQRPNLERGHERSATYQGPSSSTTPSGSSASSSFGPGNPLQRPSSSRAGSSPFEFPRVVSNPEARQDPSPLMSGVSPRSLARPNQRRPSSGDRSPSEQSLKPGRSRHQSPGIPNAANGYAHKQALSIKIQDEFGQLNGLGISRALPKVLSPTTMDGTPRSSVDFYSNSNHSAETLASEYVVPGHSRQPSRVSHQRQASHLLPVMPTNRPPEILMMGYVQLMGSFTLDGSLVNLKPFETVKRKGVIGGQGSGGVVGLEVPKRSSGILGGLSWGNLGESLGGLLGGSELSSIREMKGIASAKSVPILSTSQTILFVNLKLNPGESKSFSYCHVLPKGMPPTHRGRAMKVAYQLVIGTQRAQAAAQQHLVRHVELPFRVLPSITVEGETIAHDLLNPHVILDNIARTKSIGAGLDLAMQNVRISDGQDAFSEQKDADFFHFIGKMLNKPRRSSALSLLSPLDPLTPTPPNFGHGPDLTMQEKVNLVIQRSNAPTSAKRSANRFQIQRAGDRIATISLARSAFRLGDTVSARIDFRDASIRCYAVHISLETSEAIDPDLALRSDASIYRATRRVHSSRSEQSLCSDRVYFECMIPTGATPEFVTSGVRLDWKLRVEFVTSVIPTQGQESASAASAASATASASSSLPPLLLPLVDDITDDERGRIFVPAPYLLCESFDVEVPIRVYGAVVSGGENEINGLSI